LLHFDYFFLNNPVGQILLLTIRRTAQTCEIVAAARSIDLPSRGLFEEKNSTTENFDSY